MTSSETMTRARGLDFTRSVEGFHQFPGFGERVTSFIREPSDARLLVVLDRGFQFREEAPHVVTDHLNLSGDNPLVGPNVPCGERFPSVNGVYVTDLCPGLRRGIAAGLHHGVFPTAEEMKLIRGLGADFCCYNLVPTMIVAAHAGYRVLGIVVPEKANVAELVEEVMREMSEGRK